MRFHAYFYNFLKFSLIFLDFLEFSTVVTRNRKKLLEAACIRSQARIVINRITTFEEMLLNRRRIIDRRITMDDDWGTAGQNEAVGIEEEMNIDSLENQLDNLEPMEPADQLIMQSVKPVVHPSAQKQANKISGRAILFLAPAHKVGFRSIANRRQTQG